MMATREEIEDFLVDIAPSGEFVLADGFESAFVGAVTRYGMEPVALYDYNKCIQILCEQGMHPDIAAEYFGFNVLGSWNGAATPAFGMFTKTVAEKLGADSFDES